MEIVLLAGGQSPERDVSLVTGKAVRVALEDLGHTVTPLDPGRDLPQQLWLQAEAGCDFVWIALHGAGGEDGTVQAMLDWLGLPYQGPGYLASALAMDKWVAKQIFEATGLSTPKWLSVNLKRESAPNWNNCIAQLGAPVVVKPVATGSTMGITIARSPQDYERSLELARQHDERLILEQYIAGKELTVSVIGDRILPPIEIVPAEGDFYDYEAKYAPGGSRHLIPTSLSRAGEERAGAIAKRAYDALHCEGLARIDLRIDAAERAWILEVNTLPGMTPTSLSPDSAAALGWSFRELVRCLLAEGMHRRQRLVTELV
ncbi:D-alanine--D-alanine ligase [Synechococcus sp. PCC 7336]|uniref:D-alanine--D-alanine ligase n=1 Tax=Synechococcus sp. PCC 7336 TaxID=195250 RepID=UPI00034CCCC5|nr:D-alanine--D-alanine ligase [Synechococcus sp. PCC 7336]